jgi:hypothetical protein
MSKIDVLIIPGAKRLKGRQVTFLLFVVCLHTLPTVAIFTGARLIDGARVRGL